MRRKDWLANKDPNDDVVFYFCPTCHGGEDDCSCCRVCLKPIYLGINLTPDTHCRCGIDVRRPFRNVGTMWSMDIYESSQVASPEQNERFHRALDNMRIVDLDRMRAQMTEEQRNIVDAVQRNIQEDVSNRLRQNNDELVLSRERQQEVLDILDGRNEEE